MSYIIAHRGVWLHAPENTLPAFRGAVEMGLDGIETDIQLTADGQLVIHHNYSVDGTAGRSGKISQMTLAQLKALDFGSYRGEAYAGQQIATLEECLETVRSLSVINLELKAPEDRTFPYVEKVIETVQRFGLVSKVILSAFDHDLLVRAKEICPQIQIGMLLFPSVSAFPAAEIIRHALPSRKPLSSICRENITLSEEEKQILLQADIVAKKLEEVVMELIHSLGAVYPDKNPEQIWDIWDRQKDIDSYIRNLDFKPEFLHPYYQTVLQDRTMISRLALQGIEVNPYTPDEFDDLKELWDLGCYGIITNRPDTLLGIREGQQDF